MTAEVSYTNGGNSSSNNSNHNNNNNVDDNDDNVECHKRTVALSDCPRARTSKCETSSLSSSSVHKRRNSHFEKSNYPSALDGIVAAANAVGGDSDVMENTSLSSSSWSTDSYVTEGSTVKLLTFREVPDHLAFNRNIRSGYRSALTLQQCIASIFWLTNETINIWSHLFGCFLFMGMLLYDLCLLNFHASLTDKFIVGGLLLCFQGCMITSVLYHTFNCRSEGHFRRLLKYDLYGISFSLLAIYMSGIYYAFWCNVKWCIFYSVTVGTIFAAVIVIQIFSSNEMLKIGIFVLWAVYGIIPTVHWMFTMGGWNNPIVQKLLPRVINMYVISGIAFLVYISYIPERFFPGRFDFFGSSHQTWHCLVVYALYYWHNTGIHYIEYRMNHSCFPL